MVDKKTFNSLIKKLNEAGGKVFELMTYLLFESVYGAGQVTYQPRPPYMLINPDLGIGDIEEPSTLVLITHATAINSAGVKIDRSIEELFQAKTRAPVNSIPKVVSIIWHSPVGWAEGQLKRIDSAFDLNWVAFRDSDQYVISLEKIIALCEKTENLDFQSSLSIVKESGVIDYFKDSFTNIYQLFLEKKQHNKTIWHWERNRCISYRELNGYAIKTNMKYDLISMLPIPSDLFKKLCLSNNETVKFSSEYEGSILAGGLSEKVSLKGREVCLQPELFMRIQEPLNFLGFDVFSQTLSLTREEHGIESIDLLFESNDDLKKKIDLVRNSLQKNQFYELVLNSWEEESGIYTGRCWPIEFAVAILKIFVDRYLGLLTIERESIGNTGNSFPLSKLIAYVNGSIKLLGQEEIRSICQVITEYFKTISLPSDSSLISVQLQHWFKREYMKKKKSNPLLWFVRNALLSQGVTLEGFPSPLITFQCPFAQKVNLRKASGANRWHFRTYSDNEKRKILHVLSSYSSSHKHKEYSAKQRLIRYTVSHDQFVQRDEFDEIGIILDGIWREHEVQMFLQSGVVVFPIDRIQDWINWCKE